ncbi:MarR family transcriptional regulator [Streptomyces zhihengii]
MTAPSGALTAAELAERLRVSPASVSKAVGYLEALDVLTRRYEPGGAARSMSSTTASGSAPGGRRPEERGVGRDGSAGHRAVRRGLSRRGAAGGDAQVLRRGPPGDGRCVGDRDPRRRRHRGGRAPPRGPPAHRR